MARRWPWVLAAVAVLVAFVVEAVVQERVWVRVCLWSCLYAGVSLRDWGHKPSDPLYQSFLDELPVSRFSLDVGQRLTFGPERVRQTPTYMGRFDWLVDHFPFGSWPRMHPDIVQFIRGLGMTADVRRVRDPRAVYASPHSIRQLLNETAGLPESGASQRTLVIGGTDMHLSDALGPTLEVRQETLAVLRARFGRIRAEARDVDVEGVEVMPIGLPENYLRSVNVTSARHAMAHARIADKEEGVLAAWGKWMRICKFPHLDRDVVACNSRARAREWAESEEARGVGVQVRTVAGESWWSELSRYRFIISPLGAGVQSSKVIEALLVLTIPIVERQPYPAHDDMRRLGFPIVVVDSWSEVAKPGQLDAWWKELSPQLERFRELCLTADGYWRIATGEIRHCGGNLTGPSGGNGQG